MDLWPPKICDPAMQNVKITKSFQVTRPYKRFRGCSVFVRARIAPKPCAIESPDNSASPMWSKTFFESILKKKIITLKKKIFFQDFFFENPQNPKILKKQIFINIFEIFWIWGIFKKKSWFFFKVMIFFSRWTQKKLDHIGDAELSELSIAHGFGAIRARTKTLQPRNLFGVELLGMIS